MLKPGNGLIIDTCVHNMVDACVRTCQPKRVTAWIWYTQSTESIYDVKGQGKCGVVGLEEGSHSLFGLYGESEDSVGSTALSVHGGGRNSPVHPSRPQDLDTNTSTQPLTSRWIP